MARVKKGMIKSRRHRRVLKLAKGYFGSKHRLYKTAHEQVLRSWMYAYRDRRNKKRDFRRLWIQRISAASKMQGLSYSRLIHGLKIANVEINRKMLSELAIHDQEAFIKIVDIAKEALAK